MKHKKLIVFFSILLLLAVTVACKKEPAKQQAEELPAPQNLRVENEYLVWDTIGNAEEYVILHDGAEYHTTEPKLDIFEMTDIPDHPYSFQVYAVGDYQNYLESDLSAPFVYQFESFDSWEYQLDKNGTGYTVGIANPTKIKGKILVPSEYEGKPIVGVKISECEQLTSILLQEPTKGYSFSKCGNLSRVRLSPALTEFSVSGFSDCPLLQGVKLPASVTEIKAVVNRKDIFTNNINITLDPDNVHFRIEENCVIRNVDETVVLGFADSKIPDGVKAIGKYAFSTVAIDVLEIAGSVKSIEEAAFRNSLIKTVVISEDVQTIGDSAFEGCEQLESVRFSEGLQSIGKDAFGDCLGLKKIELPTTLSMIDPTAFCNCDNIVELKIADGNEKYRSSGNCIVEILARKVILGVGKNCQIPSGVKSIGYKSFWEAPVEHIVIPEGVMKIEATAFKMSNLKALYLPDTLQEIGANAFEWCTSLRFIYYPASITAIRGWTFKECLNIQAISVAPGAYIGPGTFTNNWPQSFSIVLPANTTVKKGIWSASYVTVYCDTSIDDWTQEPDAWEISSTETGVNTCRKCTYGQDGNVLYVSSISVEFEENGKCKTIYIDSFWPYLIAPYREGYTFAGWSTEPDGEILIAPQEMDLDPSEENTTNRLVCMTQEQLESLTPLGDITLYAVWVKNA